MQTSENEREYLSLWVGEVEPKDNITQWTKLQRIVGLLLHACLSSKDLNFRMKYEFAELILQAAWSALFIVPLVSSP